MKNKLISLLLSLILIATISPKLPLDTKAEEFTASFEYGNYEIKYLLDTDEYTATVKEVKITNGDTVEIPNTVKFLNKTYEITQMDNDNDPIFNTESRQKLKTLNIGDNMEKIGNYSISYCSSLTTVNINNPSKLEVIGNGAFAQCTSLQKVFNVSKNLQTIGIFAFKGCNKLTEVNLSACTNNLLIFTGAFEDCENLRTVNLPENLFILSSGIFANCKNLNNIFIPAGVKFIYDDSFLGCTNLSSIDVDKQNTIYSSDNGILFNKEKTKLILYPEGKSGTYKMPENTEIIDSNAFRNSNLTNVELSTNLKNIFSNAFIGASKLSNVDFTKCNNLITIEDYAFQDCTELKEVSLPNSIVSLGKSAFENCTSLRKLTLPQNEYFNTISERSFYNCSSLSSVKIPTNVEVVGASAFQNCKFLTSINFGEKGETTRIKEIGTKAFLGCNHTWRLTPRYATIIFYGILSFDGINLGENWHDEKAIIIPPDNNNNNVIDEDSSAVTGKDNNNTTPDKNDGNNNENSNPYSKLDKNNNSKSNSEQTITTDTNKTTYYSASKPKSFSSGDSTNYIIIYGLILLSIVIIGIIASINIKRKK